MKRKLAIVTNGHNTEIVVDSDNRLFINKNFGESGIFIDIGPATPQRIEEIISNLRKMATVCSEPDGD